MNNDKKMMAIALSLVLFPIAIPFWIGWFLNRFIFIKISRTKKWNYNSMNSLWDNILFHNNIQLFCSFDLWPIILTIFTLKINNIKKEFTFHYWINYNLLYFDNFGTYPEIPINSINK